MRGGPTGQACQAADAAFQFRLLGIGQVVLDDNGQHISPTIFGAQVIELHQAGAHAVLDVVDRVGDIVGPVHHLGLETPPSTLIRGRANPVEHRRIVGVHPELAVPSARGQGYLITASRDALVRLSPA